MISCCTKWRSTKICHSSSSNILRSADTAKGKAKANETHKEVGRKVRQTIRELGGTMPEDLPTPEKSIKQLENEQQKKLGENKDTND